jgi:hypothetical protein
MAGRSREPLLAEWEVLRALLPDRHFHALPARLDDAELEDRMTFAIVRSPAVMGQRGTKRKKTRASPV